MRAYSEDYLDDAQASLGAALDYAVYDLGLDADWFLQLFVVSGLARLFEHGNPKYVAGMSGIELADCVLQRTGNTDALSQAEPTLPLEHSSWYWTGWILAYYQWHSALSFAQIAEYGLAPTNVQQMYVLHEADPSAFIERADAMVAEARAGSPTNLRRLRKARKMTQAELAQASGTSLRMIQLYEQRQSNIDSAAGATLYRLARVLGCSMECLLEEPMSERYEYGVVL